MARSTKRKTAAASEKPAPEASAVIETTASGTQIKKKDFIERVTTLLGGRKGNVKEVVDAVLKTLGDAAHAGEDMILPPLGRVRIVKPKDGAAAPAAVTMKLRRGTAGKAKKTDAEPLAEGSEDS